MGGCQEGRLSSINGEGTLPQAPGQESLFWEFRTRPPGWVASDGHTRTHAERLLFAFVLGWEEAGPKSSILKPKEAVGRVTRRWASLVQGYLAQRISKTEQAEIFHMAEGKAQEDAKETEALPRALKVRLSGGPRCAQHHRHGPLAPCLPSSSTISGGSRLDVGNLRDGSSQPQSQKNAG